MDHIEPIRVTFLSGFDVIRYYITKLCKLNMWFYLHTIVRNHEKILCILFHRNPLFGNFHNFYEFLCVFLIFE